MVMPIETYKLIDLSTVRWSASTYPDEDSASEDGSEEGEPPELGESSDPDEDVEGQGILRALHGHLPDRAKPGSGLEVRLALPEAVWLVLGLRPPEEPAEKWVAQQARAADAPSPQRASSPLAAMRLSMRPSRPSRPSRPCGAAVCVVSPSARLDTCARARELGAAEAEDARRHLRHHIQTFRGVLSICAVPFFRSRRCDVPHAYRLHCIQCAIDSESCAPAGRVGRFISCRFKSRCSTCMSCIRETVGQCFETVF